MSSSSVHFPANSMIPFLFVAEQKATVHTPHTSFTRLSVYGHVGWLHNLAIVNKAVKAMTVQVSQWHTDSESFWRMPRGRWYSWIVQVFYFQCFEAHPWFHSGWANLCSSQQYMRFLFPSTCICLLLYSVFFWDLIMMMHVCHSMQRCVELVFSFYLYLGPGDQTQAIGLVRLVFHQRPLPSESSAQCILFMIDLLTGVRQDFNVVWNWFPRWFRMMNIFSCIYWSFAFYRKN